MGDVVFYGGNEENLAGKIGMLVTAKVHGDDITAVLMNGFNHVGKTRKGDEWQTTDTMQICLLSAIKGTEIWAAVEGPVLTLALAAVSFTARSSLTTPPAGSLWRPGSQRA